MSDLVTIKNTILSVQESFEKLATTDINFQKEIQFAMQIIESNAGLAEVCIKNPSSLRNAIINVSAINLSLNPATKFAYLVPRDGKVCLDISYIGLSKLATDSGSILWVQAQIVREKDDFKFHGVGLRPTHSYNPFALTADRGEIIGAYCVAKTADNEFLCNPMSLDEILDIRDRTAGYQAWENKKIKSTPWVSDFSEMAKKTVIRRDYKLWPKSERLSKAIDILNEDDGINFVEEQAPRDVTPPAEADLDKVKALVLELENGETRLLTHINIKYKPKDKIESLSDFNAEQVKYSLEFLKSHVDEARKIKTNKAQGAQA